MDFTYFDIQGHRGCRGLMPENTIPAFLKAVLLGVDTLEMDLAVSADGQLVVSHEPFFSHEISKTPQGVDISFEDEKKHNIYQMYYSLVKQYDVGSRKVKRFPNQKKLRIEKPLFKDVVFAAEQAVQELERKPVFYNIEIKRLKETDGIFHPPASEFVELVHQEIFKLDIPDRVIIQSFDIESLQISKQSKSTISVSLLIENIRNPQQNIEMLGFTPEIYSPNYKLVNENLAHFCDDQEMKLIPWTVNSRRAIRKMIKYGVEGIISDYPDRVFRVINEFSEGTIAS